MNPYPILAFFLGVATFSMIVLNYPTIKAHSLLRREMKLIKRAVLRFKELSGQFPYANHDRTQSGTHFVDMLPRDLSSRVFWSQPRTPYEPRTYYVLTRWPAPDRIGCRVRGTTLVKVKHPNNVWLDQREERELNIKR